MLELRVREIRADGIVYSHFDIDAQNYFTRIELAGSSISAGEKEAINTFVLAAKAHGYWSNLDRINVFCGRTMEAALVPLKIGGGATTDIQNNFDNDPPHTFYSPGCGFKGSNSISTYIDTTWNCSTSATAHDTHHAFYIRSRLTGNPGGTFGALDGGDRLLLEIPDSSDTFLDDQYDSGSGRVTTSSVNSEGFVIGTRTASNSHVVYQNGSSIGNNTTSGGSLPDFNWYVFAFNAEGSAGEFSNHIVSAYSLGKGLDATKAADYSSDMETLQTALGRGVNDLLIEDFERGVKPPDTFDNSSGFNYSASPISGTYSLRQLEGSYLVFFFPKITESEIYFKVRFKPELLPNPSSNFLEILSPGAIHQMDLTLMLDGTVKLTGGGVDVSTVATMSAGTTYYVWGYYKKGSGANAEMRVWFNTSDSRPANGSNNSAGATNGTQTVDVDGLVLTCGSAASNDPVFVFDELRGKTVDFT